VIRKFHKYLRTATPDVHTE